MARTPSRTLTALTAVAVALALAACTSGDRTPAAPPPLLEDVTAASGVSAQQGSGPMTSYPFTGQAWGDTDNDGRPELALTAGTGGNLLWQNLGDGAFEISTWSEDITLPLNRSGRAVFADADSDGWLDLTVSTAEGLVLLRNLEGMGFADETVGAGLADAGPAPTAAAWGDIDGDGRLDLYVVHGGCPVCLPEMADRLYLNNGDGTFADMSAAITRTAPDGAGTDAAWGDLDRDGDPDLVVTADATLAGSAVTVLVNDTARCGSPCLVEATGPGLVAVARRTARSVGVAELDGAGAPPVVLVATSEGVAALRSGASGWTDVTADLGLGAEMDAAGVTASDIDGDGTTDLYVTAASGDDVLYLGTRDGERTVFSAEGTSERIPRHTGGGAGAGAAAAITGGATIVAVGELEHPYRLFAPP